MELTILLFGITRDILGGDKATTALPRQKSSVGELRQELLKSYPQLKKLNSLMIAVNNEYAEDDQQISEKDEIALIPPVSGG